MTPTPNNEALAAERKRFEHWYITHAFDYSRDPIGSRDCSLQWVAWQAALASSGQAASAVPEGMRLVPIEPTPEMLKAGNEKTWVLPSRDCWAAMLAASPTQPASALAREEVA